MLKRLLLPLTVLLAMTAAGPAPADTGVLDDGTTTAGPMEIQRSAFAWIDTNSKAAGPSSSSRAASGSPLADLSREELEGDGDPLPCAIDQALNFDDDVVRWTTGPDCLGKYGAVCVSATTRGAGETDRSPGAKSFHSWVERH